MKLNTYLLGILFMGGSLALGSCSGNTDSTTTKESTNDSLSKSKMNADTSNSSGNQAATDTKANPNQDAINYAVPKNAKEIIWLKAAIANGTNKELKAHAKMMLTDHENLATKVKELIAKNNYTVPTFDTTNVVDLTDKPGAAWDKAFAAKMISEHKDILEQFGKAQKTVTDPELNALITKTIPVVQSHLDMVEKLDKSLK